MLKLKQCAVCEGHFDPSMLVGIMDTFMCNVCVLDLDKIMKDELGEDYKRNLPKTTTRRMQGNIPVIDVHSPIHPKPELEPTTA